MSTPTKETMAKYLQLQYWNKYLLQQGIISQREYLHIAGQIRQKYPVNP